uniref:NYN domain-containing protein n=1 Tax=Noccaea caerulescens TaxID=107243 RepID=A0A1J3GWP1_NOCCA
MINTRDLIECYMTSIYGRWTFLGSLLDVVYSFKEKGDVSYSRPHRTKKQKPSSLSDCKDVEDLPRVEDFSTIVQGGQLGRFWRSAGKKKNDVFYCSERPVMVFWNVKQCPIPSDQVLIGVGNLRSALRIMGFHTPVKIYAYGDTHLEDQRDVFKKAIISYSLEGEHLRSSPVAKTRDYREMAVDLIIFATPTYEHPAILIVNPKPNPDSELHRVLKCLQSRNHHVLVVNPTGGDSGGGLFRGSAESVVACIQGLDGEREPITKPECWC